MVIPRFLRPLFPRDDRPGSILEKQALLVGEAGRAIVAFVDGACTAESAATVVQGLEPHSSILVHQLEDLLRHPLATPIATEDLHDLGLALDDLLEQAHRSIRAAAVLGIEEPSEGLANQLRCLGEFLQRGAELVPLLCAGKYVEIVDARRGLRRIEKAAHKAYRDALSALFLTEGMSAPTMLREKSVHDAVDDAMRWADEGADLLARVALKHA